MSGTIELRGLDEGSPPPVPGCTWDARTACHRSPAIAYADIVRALVHRTIEYSDQARKYDALADGARVHRQPRPYQTEAIAAWTEHRGRGVVVLPTGAGKSLVAGMAIDAKRRSTHRGDGVRLPE